MKANDEARMTNDEGMTKSERAIDHETRFWNDGAVGIVREEPDVKPVYDLEERTACFGEAVIDFARTIPQDAVTYRIIGQLVGAATSVGANCVEADDAVSKKEFLKNIGTWSRVGWASCPPVLASCQNNLFQVRDRETRSPAGETPTLPESRHSSFELRYFPHA
jgi:hypothetical protein